MHDDFDETQMFSAPKRKNPLAAYYRTPGLHVKLPSGGRFMPPNSIEFTMTGEVEVYPMRAADEMLMKSPDALMSGYAIEKLLESCVPAIKVPRAITTADLDVLLVAIRAATFGEMMAVDVTCPSCGEVGSYEVSLPSMIASVKEYPETMSVRLNEDLVVHLRPYTFENATKAALVAFQVARKVQAVEEEEDTVRMRMMSEGFASIANLNEHLAAECVTHIVTPDGPVSDRALIADFLRNMQRDWMKKIQTKLGEINAIGMDKRLSIVCSSCGHAFTTEVEIDPTRFFEQSS